MAAADRHRPPNAASSTPPDRTSSPDDAPPGSGSGDQSASTRGEAPATDRAVRGLFVLALLYTLHVASIVLVPVVVSVLLAFLFAPVVTALTRLRMRRWVGAAVVVTMLVGAVGAGAYFLAGPAQRWLDELPRTLYRAEAQFRELIQPVEQVGDAADQVEDLTRGEEEEEQTIAVREDGFREEMMSRVRGGIAGAVVVAALLYFLLAWGHLLMQKLARILSGSEARRKAFHVARACQRDVSTYLLLVTMINVALGIAVGGAMALLDMPNPALWGVMAAILNYIPYVGAILGMGVVGLVALAAFQDPGSALLVAGVYLLLTGLEGNVLKPLILGRRLTLNPVAIFLGLLFLGWIWGAVGALVSVPLLAAVKVTADHVESLRPVSTLLGR